MTKTRVWIVEQGVDWGVAVESPSTHHYDEYALAVDEEWRLRIIREHAPGRVFFSICDPFDNGRGCLGTSSPTVEIAT